jgi:hypothetical protein
MDEIYKTLDNNFPPTLSILRLLLKRRSFALLAFAWATLVLMAVKSIPVYAQLDTATLNGAVTEDAPAFLTILTTI